MVTKFEKRLTRFLIGHENVSKMIPDELYLKLVFRLYTGKNLRLDHPETFNEKMQWLKLNCRREEFSSMVDKCEAKKYVEKICGGGYIIPTLGVWNSFNEIDFDLLPNQFVLKCTHDSGGLCICRDKSTFDLDSAKIIIESSMKRNFYYRFREWPYKNVKPRIIAEKYMGEESRGLQDYKFFCFSGVAKFLYVAERDKKIKSSFFDLEGKKLPFYRKDQDQYSRDLDLPTNFNEMVRTAERIASSIDVPFVRVDLYDINDHIYFSEITFYPTGGLKPFEPEEYDKKLGDMIKLPV